MNALVVFVAVIAVVSAATEKNSKALPYNNGLFPFNQAYYPAQQPYYPGYQAGFQGYNSGYRGGYYPGQQLYYPGYQGFTGFQGYQGYNPGYQGFQGYNRGYYQAAPAIPAIPTIAPTPSYVSVSPKIGSIPTSAAPVYKAVDNKLPAIVRQSQEVNFDGNFKYGYETENGIVAQASGYLKNAGTENAAQVIEGSYAYIGDDGAPVEVKYYADETGYHAVGNVVPTTPPEIARSLELIASQPQKPEDSEKK